MRVLVTNGSTRGGTQELAEMVGADLRAEGLTVDVVPPGKVRHINDYDTVIPPVPGTCPGGTGNRAGSSGGTRGNSGSTPTYFFSQWPP